MLGERIAITIRGDQGHRVGLVHAVGCPLLARASVRVTSFARTVRRRACEVHEGGVTHARFD